MNSLETLAERLAWARNAGGLTQRKLGRLAGLATNHISLLESGRLRGSRGKTAERIAKVLGVRVGWLAYGEGVQPSERRIRRGVAEAERSPLPRPQAPRSRRSALVREAS